MITQPAILRGNPFSDAYWAALRRADPVATPKCAYCGATFGGAPHMSDGQTMWCDASHHALWSRQQLNKNLARALVEQGWTQERWAARPKEKRR